MKIKKKIVYLGTKPIGAHCLKFLLEQQQRLNIEVIAIGTQDRKEFSDENEIIALANKYHIPLLNHPNDIPECDIIYSVQYHKILKQQHIDKAREIAVNLHLAPLPDYRGCNQFSFAIFDGATVFGVTIHLIDTGVDSGDILFEDRFLLEPDIWVKELLDKSVAHGQQLFEATLDKIIQKDYTLTPQTSLVASRGLHIYTRKDIQDLKLIRLDENASKIAKRIRATYMPGFEPPHTIVSGKKIYFIPDLQ
jgi:methionyl-tRNA formyltransferase